MFNHRSDKIELMDDLTLASNDLKRNLDEIELLNRLFGSKKLLISTLNKIRHKHLDYFCSKKVKIGDLGCGNGDMLRAVYHWGDAKNLELKLTGIDANPFTIQYAKEKSGNYPSILYETCDIFSEIFTQYRFDITCLNSVCHHFKTPKLAGLLHKLKQQTSLAIIINDLHRHWLSYHTIKWLTQVCNYSYLTQHDAPLSVLRAFRRQELVDCLQEAGIKNYEIHWSWPFRWIIIVWINDFLN